MVNPPYLNNSGPRHTVLGLVTNTSAIVCIQIRLVWYVYETFENEEGLALGRLYLLNIHSCVYFNI